jgi:tetratricopeptide (TPR) repeat protein
MVGRTVGRAQDPDPRQARPVDKVAAPRSNPAHADPARELQRLRLEGLANFEAGITVKSSLPLFEAALKLNPRSAVELFNLGVTQWKLKQLAEARGNLEKAMAADAALPNPPYVLALMEKAAGNAEAAVKLMEKARELAPAEPTIHYQLGALYRTLGREEAAVQSLTHVVTLDPHHTGALYQIYQYHRRAGNSSAACSGKCRASRI